MSREQLGSEEREDIPFEIRVLGSDIHLPYSLPNGKSRVPVKKEAGTRLTHKGEMKMNTKLNALCLGGLFALTFFMTKPVMADEWNKRTEFEFSGPVEIPGKTLAPGKYVFELEDSQSDRQIVQIFSKDSDGNESLVTTILAIPDYVTKTPDKPIINFEERPSGTPEAVHNWFYPGDNAGWAFVYPKGQNLEASANTTPAPAPVTTAAAPRLPSTPEVQEQAPAPQIQDQSPAPKTAAVKEEVVIAQNDAPALEPTQDADTEGS